MVSHHPPTRLPPDYHSHTYLCKHAEDTPMAYALAAAEAGVEELACTEHCPTDDGFDIEHRMELGSFPLYRSWVEEARLAVDLPIRLGVEADYYPGCERFLRPWLEDQDLDLVLGSVHYLDYWNGQGLWDGGDARQTWETYLSMVRAMAATGLYDIASHLDLPKRFGARLPLDELRAIMLPALDALAEYGMAMEINTSGLNVPAGECYPSVDILSWARERDIPLSFGSDAHTPERVGADFDLALVLAREAGYTQSVRYEKRQRRLVELPAP